MRAGYRQAMDLLYLACASLAGAALVLITLIIPWGVFTRYGLNSAASWPEPAAVLLAIVLTFLGAAACYRVGQHMQVTFVRDHLPPTARRIADVAAELLVGALAGFMAVWGYRLCVDTWNQSIAEFPDLSVGVTCQSQSAASASCCL